MQAETVQRTWTPLDYYYDRRRKSHIALASQALIQAPTPVVGQSTNFSCGSACLYAALRYWKSDTGVFHEADLWDALKMDEDGCEPEDLVEVSERFGLSAEYRIGMTLDDLREKLQAGVPVILLLQAWRDDPSLDWKDAWEDGHYAMIVGIDDEKAYFMDPSYDAKTYRWMPISELLDRWHNEGIEGDQQYRLGISIRGYATSPAAVVTPFERFD
jgi:predicted double-glycine peptidase